MAPHRLDAAREVTTVRMIRAHLTHARGIEEFVEEDLLERAAAAQLLERHAVRLSVIGQDVEVVAVLGHAPHDARELVDGAIDAPQRAPRPTVAGSEPV